MITRREFVCGVACAAVAGKLVGQESGTPNNEKLVAPCGLYCGACTAYLATHDDRAGTGKAKGPSMQCDACMGNGRAPAHVSKCAIKVCAAEKTKTGRCSECADFPCSIISDFNNDGVQHHGEVLENLRQLRTMGITEWTKHEEDRWSCSQCKTKLAWYDAECPKCKTTRSNRLFPLRKA